MKKKLVGFVVLALVLTNYTNGYTHSTDILRRSYAEPQIDLKINGIENSDRNILYLNPLDTFLRLDKDKNQFLDKSEISFAVKEAIINSREILTEKDLDLNGLISVSEFLKKKTISSNNNHIENSAMEQLQFFFDEYGILSGLVALIVLFAGIRYSLNS